MEADKLRRSTIALSLLLLDSVHKTFPEVASPADVTPEMANEFKRRRAEDERGLSAWTIKGNIAGLKAIFGKWLGKECGLLDPAANPFANVKPPRCDEPDVRIVTAERAIGILRLAGEAMEQLATAADLSGRGRFDGLAGHGDCQHEGRRRARRWLCPRGGRNVKDPPAQT